MKNKAEKVLRKYSNDIGNIYDVSKYSETSYFQVFQGITESIRIV